jgi:hypothetical protein
MRAVICMRVVICLLTYAHAITDLCLSLSAHGSYPTIIILTIYPLDPTHKSAGGCSYPEVGEGEEGERVSSVASERAPSVASV